jgi:DNA-directed RNA polymerase specialized sigma24 family protein
VQTKIRDVVRARLGAIPQHAMEDIAQEANLRMLG